MAMIRSATSAKATTSVRRMTGGSSALLSGTGVPSGSLGEEHAHWEGHARWFSPREGANVGARPNCAPANRTLADLTRGGPRRFHRGFVSDRHLDSDRCRHAPGGTASPPSAFVRAESITRCASNGAAHDTASASTRRHPSRATRRTRLRRRTCCSPRRASRQRSQRPGARLRADPAERVSVRPDDGRRRDDTGSVLPERLRRAVVRFRHPRSARHHHHRYRQHRALLRAWAGPRHPLRRRRRPRGLYLVRRADASAARRNGRTGIRRPR